MGFEPKFFSDWKYVTIKNTKTNPTILCCQAASWLRKSCACLAAYAAWAVGTALRDVQWAAVCVCVLCVGVAQWAS